MLQLKWVTMIIDLVHLDIETSFINAINLNYQYKYLSIKIHYMFQELEVIYDKYMFAYENDRYKEIIKYRRLFKQAYKLYIKQIYHPKHPKHH